MSAGDWLALAVALVVVAYHYVTTRDARRTLRRIAAALENLSGDYGLDDDEPELG